MAENDSGQEVAERAERTRLRDKRVAERRAAAIREHYTRAIAWSDTPPQPGEQWPTPEFATAQWHLHRAQSLEGFQRVEDRDASGQAGPVVDT